MCTRRKKKKKSFNTTALGQIRSAGAMAVAATVDRTVRRTEASKARACSAVLAFSVVAAIVWADGDVAMDTSVAIKARAGFVTVCYVGVVVQIV